MDPQAQRAKRLRVLLQDRQVSQTVETVQFDSMVNIDSFASAQPLQAIAYADRQL